MIVYLAGPMTGLPDYNRAGFEEAERYATARGWTFASPRTTDPSHPGGCPQGELQSTAAGTHPYGCWVRASLRMLLACDEVLMLPGWEASRGACLEKAVAQACGMPIHHLSALETR